EEKRSPPGAPAIAIESAFLRILTAWCGSSGLNCGIPMKSSAESGLKRAVIPVEIEHIHG
ncbi:MAG: hypothetical protein OEU26_31390, partial [Candidatus Tectomicrobia bacterium]|nr:hypothetical protein [Candidatus Tectomicrobia bacterium]